MRTGEVAARLEQELGIAVLRHSEKKPAGSAADLEAHFGYALILFSSFRVFAHTITLLCMRLPSGCNLPLGRLLSK